MSLLSIITIVSGIGCLVMLVMWRLEANTASPNGEEIGDRAKEIGRRLKERLEEKARSARKFGTGFAVAALCCVLMNKFDFWTLPRHLVLLAVFLVVAVFLVAGFWLLVKYGSLTRAIDDIVDPLTQEEVRKGVEQSNLASLVIWKSRSEMIDEQMAESANLRYAAKRRFKNSLIGTASLVLLSALSCHIFS